MRSRPGRTTGTRYYTARSTLQMVYLSYKNRSSQPNCQMPPVCTLQLPSFLTGEHRPGHARRVCLQRQGTGVCSQHSQRGRLAGHKGWLHSLAPGAWQGRHHRCSGARASAGIRCDSQQQRPHAQSLARTRRHAALGEGGLRQRCERRSICAGSPGHHRRRQLRTGSLSRIEASGSC